MPHVLYRSGETTPRTILMIPSPETYDFIYGLALDAGERFTWRGRSPARGAIEEVCWIDTYEHAVIYARRSRLPIGYVCLTRMNTHHGTAYLSLYLIPEARYRGYPMEAVCLLLRRLVTYTDCRKVYVERYRDPGADTSEDFGPFALEGCLKDYLRVRGTLVDMLIGGATRDVLLEATAFVANWQTPESLRRGTD